MAFESESITTTFSRNRHRDAPLFPVSTPPLHHTVTMATAEAETSVEMIVDIPASARHGASAAAATSSNSHEISQWLKGVLLFGECTKCICPFVDDVMRRLLRMVVEEIKSTVVDHFGSCRQTDWDCNTDVHASNPHFTDIGPLALKVASMDCDGIIMADTMHYLKAGTMIACGLQNVPSALFAEADNPSSGDSEADSLFIYSAQTDHRPHMPAPFIILHQIELDPMRQLLTPFRVVPLMSMGTITLPSGWGVYLDPQSNEASYLHRATNRMQVSAPYVHDPPATKTLYVVLCKSCPGRTKRLVDSHERGIFEPIRGQAGRENFAFWSLELVGGSWIETKHGFKEGTIISFCGSSEFDEGFRYVVKQSTDFSFCVDGPIVRPQHFFDAACPVSPHRTFLEKSLSVFAGLSCMTRDAPSLLPFCVVRRSPVGRIRDTARKYHSRGEKAQIEWSGIRAHLLSSHHGEFCKLFCGRTKRDFLFFEEGKTENSEQFFNMIDMCKAFHGNSNGLDRYCDIFCSLYEECSELQMPAEARIVAQSLIELKQAASSMRSFRNQMAHELLKAFTLDVYNDFERCVQTCIRIVCHISKLTKNDQACAAAENAQVHADRLKHRDFARDRLSESEASAAVQLGLDKNLLKELLVCFDPKPCFSAFFGDVMSGFPVSFDLDSSFIQAFQLAKFTNLNCHITSTSGVSIRAEVTAHGIVTFQITFDSSLSRMLLSNYGVKELCLSFPDGQILAKLAVEIVPEDAIRPPESVEVYNGLLQNSPVPGIISMLVKFPDGNTVVCSGNYNSLSIPEFKLPGFYELTFKALGFDDYGLKCVHYKNLKNSVSLKRVLMTHPIVSGQFRVVLSWAKQPRDLDLYCTTRNSSTSQNHTISFRCKNVDDQLGCGVKLDVDVTAGNGPETITVTSQPGQAYVFYVHNFSNEALLSSSNACLRIVGVESLSEPIMVPPSCCHQDQRYWEVFRLINGQSIVVNKLVKDEPKL
jgi:hypothetical protein